MIETVKPEETFSDKLDQDLGSEPEYEIVVSCFKILIIPL